MGKEGETLYIMEQSCGQGGLLCLRSRYCYDGRRSWMQISPLRVARGACQASVAGGVALRSREHGARVHVLVYMSVVSSGTIAVGGRRALTSGGPGDLRITYYPLPSLVLLSVWSVLRTTAAAERFTGWPRATFLPADRIVVAETVEVARFRAAFSPADRSVLIGAAAAPPRMRRIRASFLPEDWVVIAVRLAVAAYDVAGLAAPVRTAHWVRVAVELAVEFPPTTISVLVGCVIAPGLGAAWMVPAVQVI